MLDQPDGSHKEIVRSYTPISGDEVPGFFDLLIKSYPTGNISKHMASLSVSQTIRVRGPKGAFNYRPNLVRHFGMVAGGTGITPMLQIVKAVIRGRAAGDRTEIDLIFANVTEKDILLKEDLDALAAEDKGFRVHYVLDKPPADWTGGVGYVTSDMITVCVCSGRRLYVCDYVVVIRWLTRMIEMAACARRRRQDLVVRSSSHDCWDQEVHRGSRLQEGSPCQQARGSSLCFLNILGRPSLA